MKFALAVVTLGTIVGINNCNAQIVSVKLTGTINNVTSWSLTPSVAVGDQFEFDYLIDYSIPPFSGNPQNFFYYPVATTIKIGGSIDFAESGWFTTYNDTVFGDGYGFDAYMNSSTDFIQYSARLWTSDLDYLSDSAAPIQATFPLLGNIADISVNDSPLVNGAYILGYEYDGIITGYTVSLKESAVPEPTAYGAFGAVALVFACLVKRKRK